MPRFFFHLDGPAHLEDDEGEEFSTSVDAVAHAQQVAQELARNAPPAANLGKWVVVTDEHQRELVAVPLSGSVLPR